MRTSSAIFRHKASMRADAPTALPMVNQSPAVSRRKVSLFSIEAVAYVRSPNKAPEPTPGAVTPRAISRTSEMKPQTPNRHAARGAPAPGVAHL